MNRFSLFKKIYGRTFALAMVLCLLLSDAALSENLSGMSADGNGGYMEDISEGADSDLPVLSDDVATPGVYTETGGTDESGFIDDGESIPSDSGDGIPSENLPEEIPESMDDAAGESTEDTVPESPDEDAPEPDEPEAADGFRSIGYEPARITRTKLRRLGSSLPSYYSSLDLGYLTNVKHQGSTGNCWAFSAVNLAESNMLRKGAAADPDYSEFALAYYLYNRAADPMGLTEGDVNRVVSGSWLDGGSIILAAFHLSGWGGLNSEEDAPYEELIDESSVPGDIAYDNQVVLKNAYFYNKDDMAAIKTGVMEYGSVAFSYYSAGSRTYFRTITEECDYQNDVCFYNYRKQGKANHAVSIVGWDDEFPREYFNTDESLRPEKNGAWLVRNSWSDSWPSEDAPHAGYFWMSYEESTIGSEVVAGEFVDASGYDSIYYYDGTSSARAVSTKAGETAGNIYRAQKDEMLAAVSVAVHSGSSYSVQIYADHEPMENPEDGIAMLDTPLTGTALSSGIYTIDLPEPVVLEEGMYFSAAVSLNEAGALYIEEDANYGWYEVSAAIGEGQSFYRYGGSSDWQDAGSKGFCFRIKAFTKDPEEELIWPGTVMLDKENCTLTEGGSTELAAEVLPDNAFSRKVIWESSDPSIAAVDAQGIVTGLCEGTAVISAKTLYGQCRAECRITVIPEAAAIEQISMTEAGVLIQWTAVPGTGGYDIYRKEEGGEWILAGSTADPYWTDTNESIRRTYTYAVRCQEAEAFTENELTDRQYTVTEFRDVLDSSRYYYTPIYRAVEKGITNGFTDAVDGPNHFRPQYNCTRAQMMTFLWRTAGKPAPKTKKNPFKDVSTGAYYYRAVLWAAEKGITKGYSDGTFRPDDTCLREHAVTFLYRMAGKPKVKTTKNPFRDIKSSDYYYTPALWAYENGIAKGYGSGADRTYGPKLDCLREHCITFLYRYSNQSF